MSQRPPDFQGLAGQALSDIGAGIEKGFAARRAEKAKIAGEERELAGKQALKRIPMDEAIWQSAESLGLNLPPETTDIDEGIAKAIMSGAAGLAQGRARYKYLQVIHGARTRDDLLRWRSELLRDFDVNEDEKRYQLGEIDRIMRERYGVRAPAAAPAKAAPAQGPGLLRKAGEFFQGAPAKPQAQAGATSQPALPGLNYRR